jgi:hypothetical protein
MSTLTLREFLFASALVIQCFTAILAVIALGYVSDKKAWRWFVAAVTLVALRRIAAISRYAGVQSDLLSLIELAVAWVLSLCFLFYVITRGQLLRKKEQKK